MLNLAAFKKQKGLLFTNKKDAIANAKQSFELSIGKRTINLQENGRFVIIF